MMIFINSIGVLGPGIHNWNECQDILLNKKTLDLDSHTIIPKPTILPSREARRTTQTTNLALEIANQAISQTNKDPNCIYSLFASSGGDLDILDYLCHELAETTPSISPTKFHNSLHNSAAGYWSIATKSMSASTSIGACQHTFSAGLLEAATICETEKVDVLLTCYDIVAPEPLKPKVATTTNFGVAMLLSKNVSDTTFAKIDIELQTNKPITRSASPELEKLRQSNPAARSLSLLETIANKNQERIILDYLNPAVLSLSVTSEL